MLNVDSEECPGRLRINAASPDESFLLDKLLGPPEGCGDRMPLVGFLNDQEVACMRRWMFEVSRGADGGVPDAGEDAGDAGDAGVDSGTDSGGMEDVGMDTAMDTMTMPDTQMDTTMAPVDCGPITATAGWEVCMASDTQCIGVYRNGASCDALCASAGLVCVGAELDIDGACDTMGTAYNCANSDGHNSDYCICEREAM